jgi:hypothetical protein
LSASGHEIIGNKLSSDIPRGFWLTLERLVPQALAEAKALGMRFQGGHRPTASGFARHLLLNEAMAEALDEAGVSHNPLRGNAIVFGTVGVVTLARVHMGQMQWDNARRSKTKVKLCEPNAHVKKLVYPDLFEGEISVTEPIEMTAFVVTEGGGLGDHSAIHIVVTDETMDLRNPVFREELHQFVQRYQKRQDVEDRVKPKLKGNVKKLHDKTDDEDGQPDPSPA